MSRSKRPNPPRPTSPGPSSGPRSGPRDGRPGNPGAISAASAGPRDGQGRRERRGGGSRADLSAGPRLRPHEHAVPGERAVVELLRGAPKRVRRILIEDGRAFADLRALADAVAVRVDVVEREVHDALIGPGLARGVLAIADPPRSWDFEDLLARDDGPRTRRGHRLLVVCDGIQDPHNFGAVLRSAEFFGAGGVVWARDRSAPLSPAAVRSSAGASERVPLCPVTNLARALDQAKQTGDWWVIGTVVDDGRPLVELAADPPAAMIVVLGSEGAGMRRLTRERCDFLATIDGAGTLGSLNVSAAAAVTLALLG